MLRQTRKKILLSLLMWATAFMCAGGLNLNVVMGQGLDAQNVVFVFVTLGNTNEFEKGASVWIDGEVAKIDPQSKVFAGVPSKGLDHAFDVRIQCEGYETFQKAVAVKSARQVIRVELGRDAGGYFRPSTLQWRPEKLIKKDVIYVGPKTGLTLDSADFQKDKEIERLKEEYSLREVGIEAIGRHEDEEGAGYAGYIALARIDGEDFPANGCKELAAFRNAGYFAGISYGEGGFFLNSLSVQTSRKSTEDEVRRIAEAIGLTVSPTSFAGILTFSANSDVGYGIFSLAEALSLYPEIERIEVEVISMPEN